MGWLLLIPFITSRLSSCTPPSCASSIFAAFPHCQTQPIGWAFVHSPAQIGVGIMTNKHCTWYISLSLLIVYHQPKWAKRKLIPTTYCLGLHHCITNFSFIL
ncbi:hypothetical protein O6H91_02G131200 [Diphasiastrum complanatum]|uniref:Uncharacterized protein n=1 Tax=Diphasiastrum complanatum TaxID=34168 RepID=A0ACC2EL23_DIPCM|nr:hypothetical protein O6H91_02G131200 [Diphasiastrum complanatum]